jgi:trk system potassium uptake protein TrkH
MWMFMTAWSTGGFTPQSFSAGYYHSALYELVLIITMIAGSLGFALHWTVWTGRRDELWRNVETRSFAMTLGIVTTLGVAGLAAAHVYPDAVSLFRKGFFQLVSAHTTNGMMTIRGRTIVTQWGTVGMVAAAVAMALGGAIGSMSGGVKAMRVGVITRALFQDVRRVLSPDRAVISARFHHLRDIVLTDAMARAALTIAMLYMTTYVVLGIAGMVFGYTPAEALFEAVSATANAGLTCGVTQPDMPTTLKLLYMAAMWVGRLEFMSALTLVGYAWAMARGVKGR